MPEPSLAHGAPAVYGEDQTVDAHPLDIATARQAVGLRVAPSVPGNLKQPAYYDVDFRVLKLNRWEWLKERPAAAEELITWHHNPRTGHAVITGEASGGRDADGRPLVLEVLDLDSPPIAAQFLERPDLQALLNTVLIERTHKAKAHLAWKVLKEGLPPVPQKLAMRCWNGRDLTSIELLGHGQFCIISPGLDYELGHGDWLNVPVITHAERGQLIKVAQSYDQSSAQPGSRGGGRGEEHSSSEIPLGVPPPNGTPCSITGEDKYAARVHALYRDWGSVQRMLPHCGLAPDLRPGDHLPCPFHLPDEHHSATFMAPDPAHNEFGIVCMHGCEHPGLNKKTGRPKQGTFYSLVRLYRFQVCGCSDSMVGKPALVLWATRLAHDAQLLVLPHLQAPRIKDPDAPEGAQEMVNVFVDVTRHRYATRMHPGVKDVSQPWSWRFVWEWCGGRLKQYIIEKAMSWDLRKGYIAQTGTYTRERDNVVMALFRLGTRKTREAFQSAVWRSKQEATSRLESLSKHLELEQAKLEEARHPDEQSQPQACPQCGEEGFTPVDGGCQWCVILVPLQARLDAKKRLYGSPDLVELPPPKVVYGVDE